MAAQIQSLRTNAVKAKIDRSQKDSLCRMCRQKDETVNHLLIRRVPKVGTERIQTKT